MRFYKYHGCGNDFLLIEEMPGCDYTELARKMCNRRLGVGADGLLVCSSSPPSMRIFNMDGSEATMCGNGIRCAAGYFVEKGVANPDERFEIRTLDGLKTVVVKSDGAVSVGMGRAKFGADCFGEEYDIDGRRIMFYRVFTGCAHAVVFCDDVFKEILFGTGEKLSSCELFPQRVNVDLVRIESRKLLTVRTYERGVGYTAACGTGACAAYAVARRLKLCDNEAEIRFELGSMKVYGGEKMTLVGDSVNVFCGEWEEK